MRWNRATGVSAIVGVTYFLVLALAATVLGTWTDEEYTLTTTAHGVGFAVQRAIHYELQAPLYFAVLAIWRELDASVWFARLFSIVCATGFYFAIVAIFKRIAPAKPAILGATLVACNPFVLYCAVDIRLYSAALLVSALSWLAFDAGFDSGTSMRARIWFCVLSIVGLYTQYFLGFTLVGFGALLLAKKNWRAMRAYACALVAIGVATIPLLGILRSQVGGSGETTAGVWAILRQTLIHPWLDFVLPFDHSWNHLYLRISYVALITFLVALIVAARPRLRPALGGALVCATVVELLFVAVVLVLHLDLNVRHYVALFVPTIVAGYTLIAELEAGRHRFTGSVFAWTFGILTLTVLVAEHHVLAQDGDTKRVAAYLREEAGPNATIAIFPADALPAYARQYRGPARLVPFPHPLPQGQYDIDEIDVDTEREASSALSNVGAAQHRLWLVMLGTCDDGGFQYGCGNVLAAIADGAVVLQEREFYDSRVYELAVKAPKPDVEKGDRAAMR